MNRRLSCLCIAACLAPALAFAADRTATVFDGVTYLHRTTSEPWDIHVLTVNLDRAGIGLSVTPYNRRGRTTSAVASDLGAKAAINGDFKNLSSSANIPLGLTVSGGSQWPGTSDNRANGTLQWAGDLSRVELTSPRTVVTKEAWMRGVIGGHPMILSAGSLPSFQPGGFCDQRQPRTAIGLSADQRTLFLAVVDGRQSDSAGMKCTEMGRMLRDLGANDALNLDGGGSSTMWIRGKGVVNDPSDGAERAVVNQLLLFANAAPAAADLGTLRVRVHDAADPTQPVTNADIALDNGDKAQTNSRGIARLGLLPGAYSGTVTAPRRQAATFNATLTRGNVTTVDVNLARSAASTDGDSDGTPDASDNCPAVANADQLDTDTDGVGNACDGDDDGDGLYDEDDACPLIANADPRDTDADGQGDACDLDDDADAVPDATDNCPLVANPDQADRDSNRVGDACEVDADADLVPDAVDNCVALSNRDQTDLDGDAIGDACDPDDDGDEVPDATDLCERLANPDQADVDRDGRGDPCDDDLDGDQVPNATDNCPGIANADQADADADGEGDACDSSEPVAPESDDEAVDGGFPPVNQTETPVESSGCGCGSAPLASFAVLSLLTARRRTRSVSAR